MSPEFQAIAYNRHFSRFEDSWEELSAQWDAMSPEHQRWAETISNNIPDLTRELGKIKGYPPEAEKARAKAIKANADREAELVAFFRAPTEPIDFGEFKGRSCRRDLYQQFIAEREKKLITKVINFTGSIVAGLGGVAVTAFGHQHGFHLPHAVGEVIPAVKELGVYGGIAGTAGLAAKEIIAKKLAQVYGMASELSELQRIADDPALARTPAPAENDLTTPIAQRETQARLFERLAAKTSPIDKLELMRLNEQSILPALVKLHAWKDSIDHMSVARTMTIRQALNEQEKARKLKMESPEWANREFHIFKTAFEDKSSFRGPRSMGVKTWANWQIVQAIARENPVASTVNASIQLFGIAAYADAATAMLNKIKARKTGGDPLLEPMPKGPARVKNWIRPPRS